MPEKTQEYLSLKPTTEIMYLLDRGKATAGTSLSNSELFELAENFVVTNEDQIVFSQYLDKKEYTYPGPLTDSLKIKVNDLSLDTQINDILKEKIGLQRIKTILKIRVILSAYIDHLSDTKPISDKSDSNLDAIKLELIKRIIGINDPKLINKLYKEAKKND